MSSPWPFRLVRWSVFIASVVTLSWFFQGWRQVNESGQLADWGVLVGGIAATFFLLTVQGYWVYADEKKKGTLTKRIGLFEKIYERMENGKGGSD